MKPTYRPHFKGHGRPKMPRGRVLASIALRTGLHKRFIEAWNKKASKRARRHLQFVDRLYRQLADLNAAGNTKKAARVQRDIQLLSDMDRSLYQFRQMKDGGGRAFFEDGAGESFGPPPDHTSRYTIQRWPEGGDRFDVGPDVGNVIK